MRLVDSGPPGLHAMQTAWCKTGGSGYTPIACRGAVLGAVYFTGITVPAGTGTAVTLFCGEPSMTRSE
jgi:hypothetical protein